MSKISWRNLWTTPNRVTVTFIFRFRQFVFIVTCIAPWRGFRLGNDSEERKSYKNALQYLLQRKIGVNIVNKCLVSWRRGHKFTENILCGFSCSDVVDQKSILPNFFLRKTKIFFCFFAIKLGHFKIQTIFSCATNTQA